MSGLPERIEELERQVATLRAEISERAEAQAWATFSALVRKDRPAIKREMRELREEKVAVAEAKAELAAAQAAHEECMAQDRAVLAAERTEFEKEMSVQRTLLDDEKQALRKTRYGLRSSEQDSNYPAIAGSGFSRSFTPEPEHHDEPEPPRRTPRTVRTDRLGQPFATGSTITRQADQPESGPEAA
jgi:hypothetical protein